MIARSARPTVAALWLQSEIPSRPTVAALCFFVPNSTFRIPNLKMSPKVLILRAPGTNCDVETAFAFERAGGLAERVHIGRLLEKPALADDFQIHQESLFHKL